MRVAERSLLSWVAALLVCLLILIVVSLGIGRYYLDPVSVIRVLFDGLFMPPAAIRPSEQIVLFEIRMPRILAALVAGTALASCGAAYQSMFRNPLVSPEILGVSNGAGFGASISILIGLPPGIREVVAFAFGLIAAVLSLGIARAVGSVSAVIIVLGGIVVGTMFGAMISTTQFFANPETTLPEITFWLFGSLARATLGNLLLPTVIVAIGLAVFYMLRWPMTVLSTGDDQARALGIDHRIVLDQAGAVNVAAEHGIPANPSSATVTLEDVISWNPEWIICRDPPTKQEILKDPRWRTVAAVQKDHVVVNPKGVFVWGVRSAEAALQPVWAAKLFYPDRFKDVDMRKVVSDFYREFYQYELSGRSSTAFSTRLDRLG